MSPSSFDFGSSSVFDGSSFTEGCSSSSLSFSNASSSAEPLLSSFSTSACLRVITSAFYYSRFPLRFSKSSREPNYLFPPLSSTVEHFQTHETLKVIVSENIRIRNGILPAILLLLQFVQFGVEFQFLSTSLALCANLHTPWGQCLRPSFSRFHPVLLAFPWVSFTKQHNSESCPTNRAYVNSP